MRFWNPLALMPRPRGMQAPPRLTRTASRPLPPLLLEAPRPGNPLEIRLAARPLTWHGCLRFPADRIQKGFIESLMPGAPDHPGELPKQRCGYQIDVRGTRDRLRGTLGFHLEEDAETATQGSALLAKLHLVLWSRAFAETDGDLSRETEVTLSQLCDDLGYARLKNGAHRPETRRHVARLLELLGQAELDLEYDAPDGSRARLTGRFWDLRAQADSRTVRYRVGEWFFHPVWRRFNAAVGLAPAGLLELRTDRDAWALRLGAYLAVLARMNGYRPLALRVRTLLEKTGLAHAERRNPARMREKLERALERLEEVGVLADWDWEANGPEPEMDDPAVLAALAEEAEHWRERKVLLRWPQPLRAREAALTSARERHPRCCGRRARVATGKIP